MSLRLKSFLQCNIFCRNIVNAATNHGTFRPIHLFHSSVLSQVLLMAFRNTIFSLLINPSEIIQTNCIFPGTQYGKKFWIFSQNSWNRFFSYNSYTFHPLAGIVIGKIIYQLCSLNMKISNQIYSKRHFLYKTTYTSVCSKR